MRDRVDVVVVGAGFAGLSTARALAGTGYDVLVLEGRDRVGGRSCTGEVAGLPVDLGAAFVGPTQDAVLALAAELGCPTTPTYHHGANLIHWRGRLRSYSGTVPALSPVNLIDVARIRWQFARLARTVAVSAPWTAPRADVLDGQSLGQWLQSVRATASTRDLLAIMSRVTWGAEPEAVSLLHALRYVKAAGGLDRMLDVQGGAQQDHFPEGTAQMAVRMAEELGDRVVLSAAVHAVEHCSTGVTVVSSAGTVDAHAVVIAVPPQHRAGISFSPALPPGPAQVADRWPQGSLSKAYAVYDTAFWRADGRSGQALSDSGPVFITFDVSPPGHDGPGVLLGFVDARGFDDLSAPQRRAQALAGFAALFGDTARHPLDYRDFSWGNEPFSAGGPTAAVPCGSWTSAGRWLREPVGRIFWAGTETADIWTGFLDGAVRSGQRAASEVIDAIR
ncbi:flavin monoamine oxidase family protein [Mycolicibacterium mengxianglii]|uniref:flavin monoamine oxidase family protein n=1 Tax=Mycolicibacterium mengxianglii TaxID=2736649 RepID=UPI001E5C0F05|nr:flavin monoamine oxidase family protein [Mycolicibacterium mengxianglii]